MQVRRSKGYETCRLRRFALASVLAAVSSVHVGATPGNLVLVTLDTTRADHLGAWGWPHARTPHLDGLAARGTRFARCDTAAPVTLPSHSTILTGLYPPRHGVRDNATFVLGAEAETVAERLAAAGYDTAAVISAVVLARRYGTAQGFRIYDDDLGGGERGRVARERRAGDVTARALALVRELEPPFFLWVHYFDPHDPYSPPPGWAEGSGPHRDYDGEIAYMDDQVGRLLAGLGPAAVVVVGDHGEMLGDHGEPTHGLLLNHGARRVPLILAGPGIPQTQTVDCLVRTADVAPTLLELAGVEPPLGLDGRSLVPLLRGEDCGRASYAESYLPFFAHRWYPLRAFSDDRWLYVHGPRPGLFDLQADPREERDLGDARAKLVAGFRARLESQVEAMGSQLEGTVGQDRTLSAEESARLRSLGYLGGPGGDAAVGRDLPDPRDMVRVAQALHRAGRLVGEGRCDEALPVLLEVTKQDVRSFPAYNMAGLCLQELGRLESALNAFRRASSLNPDAVEPVVNAGGCLVRLGRFAEAAVTYRRAMELDPTAPGVASNLAAMLRESGDLESASEVLEDAFDAGGRYAALYVERGVLAGRRGDFQAAFAAFEEAARLDPTSPDALGNAARAALLLKRPQEAAARYEELLEIVPDNAGLWTTLGRLYLDELGDRASAERCLRRALALEPDPAARAKLEALLAGE